MITEPTPTPTSRPTPLPTTDGGGVESATLLLPLTEDGMCLASLLLLSLSCFTPSRGALAFPG